MCIEYCEATGETQALSSMAPASSSSSSSSPAQDASNEQLQSQKHSATGDYVQLSTNSNSIDDLCMYLHHAMHVFIRVVFN